MPHIVTRSWWRGPTLRRAVQKIWILAHSKNPPVVTKKQWTAMLSDLESLRRALKNQSLRLHPGDKGSS